MLRDVGVVVVRVSVTLADDNTIPQASVWAGSELPGVGKHDM